MQTPTTIEMAYRLIIGVFLLLLGLVAEMSSGARIFVFAIAALAFVEACVRAVGKDPFSMGMPESGTKHSPPAH